MPMRRAISNQTNTFRPEESFRLKYKYSTILLFLTFIFCFRRAESSGAPTLAQRKEQWSLQKPGAHHGTPYHNNYNYNHNYHNNYYNNDDDNNHNYLDHDI